MSDVQELDLQDLAGSACQEALAFGVSEDAFLRFGRTVLAAAAERHKTTEAALRELVALKRLKDRAGGRVDTDDLAEYQRRQPKAWADAFACIDAIDAAKS